MGFRKDAYATIWEIESRNDTATRGRISISRKNKKTNEYETDFSGFVDFIGSSAASKALGLKEKDRIKLGDVDVSTSYNKETKKGYTNFKIFSFEMAEDYGNRGRTQENSVQNAIDTAGDGVLEEESDLPF